MFHVKHITHIAKNQKIAMLNIKKLLFSHFLFTLSLKIRSLKTWRKDSGRRRERGILDAA